MFFKKLKIELLYDLLIPLLSIYPKEHKSRYNRNTCTPHVCYSSVHNSQAMEIAIMPFNRWMDKENVVYIPNGLSSSHKEEWNYGVCRKMIETEDHVMWSMPGSEGQRSHILS
jgi:hypothetical protein